MPKNLSEFPQENYLNRELSWLEFNGRVLEEAADPTNPVLERIKFLSIVSSNLDEFFEVRVAGLQEQLYAGLEPQDFPADGLSPVEQLDRIEQRAHRLVADVLVRSGRAEESLGPYRETLRLAPTPSPPQTRSTSFRATSP